MCDGIDLAGYDMMKSYVFDVQSNGWSESDVVAGLHRLVLLVEATENRRLGKLEMTRWETRIFTSALYLLD